MRLILLGLSVALFIACAAHRPPRSISESVANRYGCDVEAIEQRAAELRSDLGPMEVYIPQVGWSACELIAHNGSPSRITRTESALGRTQNWWYRGNAEFGYVALKYDGGRGEWLVTYVSW